MNENGLRKFQDLLRTLFQYDCADLDFGIYRILNYKRGQVEAFITERLPQIVDRAFAQYAAADRAAVEQELEQTRKEIVKNLGEQAIDESGQLRNFHRTKLGRQYLLLRERQAQYQVGEELKTRVYNDLYTFFSRYYEDGDFISKRRYGRHETYAIPYNGEEVVLYWANRDQYYVKTGDRFKAYRFKVGDYSVSFELRSVSPEQNGNGGKKRYFVLAQETPISWNEQEKSLAIAFEHRPLTEAEEKEYGRTEQQKPQASLNEAAERKILGLVADGNLKAALAKPKGTNGASLLRKHLIRFTRKNTADFFIHKDLGGFLRRELDFFIKNEVLLLDELIGGKGEDFYRHLLRGRVARQVGEAIIDFLAQVEDFQKRLWEKRKFVLRTEYCLTVDRVPEELWDEVLANKAQIAEWRRLYGLEDLLKEQGLLSTGLNKDFLKAHPTLVVDTRHFPDEFKLRLLAHFDDLDEALDGLLIKSENWQTLNLLLEKYREKVQCIYVDPPYNTGSDGFVYKDNYRHSTWLSMFESRALVARYLLADSGVMFYSIDEIECPRAWLLTNQVFGDSNFASEIIWEKKKKPSFLHRNIGKLTDFILAFNKNFDASPSFSVETTTEGKLTPLNNAGNPLTVLQFPPGSVTFGCADGLYKAKDMSDGNIVTRLLDDVVVKDGTNAVAFRLEGEFRYSQAKLGGVIASGDKLYISKEPFRPNHIKRGGELKKMKNLLSTTHYSMETNEDASRQLVDIFGEEVFGNPKPEKLIRYLVLSVTHSERGTVTLDYFAGSGTTAHAVINLNRQDGGRRKYILVEIGDWFETVLLPRIKKVVFCEKWKDGKPAGGNGVSHMLKYLYLEQYEDTLNNLELSREMEGQLALEMFGDEYLLRYMLDFETQGSPSLLNLDRFKDPFAYKLKVQEGDEIVERSVDLVETFNYLLGIQVKKMRAFREDGRLYRAVLGEKNGKQVAVVWRSVVGLEGNKKALMKDKAFIEKTVLPGLMNEAKPDRLLVNGACFVKAAEAIEPEFHRLMFAPAGA